MRFLILGPFPLNSYFFYGNIFLVILKGNCLIHFNRKFPKKRKKRCCSVDKSLGGSELSKKNGYGWDTQMSLFGANRHQQNWPPLRRMGKLAFIQKNWKFVSTQKILSQTAPLQKLCYFSRPTIKQT